MMETVTIIKGGWADREADVMEAAKAGPFIFFCYGPYWSGHEADEIAALLDSLGSYPLDPFFEDYGNFIEVDPCDAVLNLNYLSTPDAPRWIDGPRIFDVGGVVRFFGNFLAVSHVFCIYTNDAETIAKLTAAIRANQQRDDYLEAKARRARHER